MKSVIPQEKIEWLVSLLRETFNSTGDVIECGVYQGGSASALAQALDGSGKRLLLLDTFTGMPKEVLPVDDHRPGDFCDVSISDVVSYFERYDFVDVVQGLFSETFGTLKTESYSFAHVDCDIYTSVRECCEYLWPKISPGGIMAFDDYGSPTCRGAKLAVDEFVTENGLALEFEHGGGLICGHFIRKSF